MVVATLVGKAPNLGGLARTSEVFNASKLVVADLAVTRSHEFAGVSMGAEQWLPIEAVPEAQLRPWLQVCCCGRR